MMSVSHATKAVRPRKETASPVDFVVPGLVVGADPVPAHPWPAGFPLAS